MISATASSEGPPAPPPPHPQQQPRPTTHAIPHHPLLGPPAPSATMAQLPMPLPLPLPHPLYPHHQLAHPPHHYHSLHLHHHHHAAAAAAMIAFEHHQGRHHLTHHLGTPSPSATTGRSPSPPRFLRPPPPPSRPLPSHPTLIASSYNGVRSPEAGDGVTGERQEDGRPKGLDPERKPEGGEGVERREESGTGAVNLVHKRVAPDQSDDSLCNKRGRMVTVNGGLGGRTLAPPPDPLGGGGFAPHGSIYPSGSPYYPSSTSASLLGNSYSPPSLPSTAPSSSAFPLSSPKQHPLLVPHSFPAASPATRPHHPSPERPLPPASSMIAPTFTSPAITVGPITTPSFSYDPFFPSPAGGQSPVKPGQSVLRRPSATHHQPPPPTGSARVPGVPASPFPPPPLLPPPPVAVSSPQQQPPNAAFKVPSGKEGSLKHRLLLTRSSEANGAAPPSPTAVAATTLSAPGGASAGAGKRRKSNSGSRSAAPSSAALPPPCSSSSSSSSSTPSPPEGPRSQVQAAGGVERAHSGSSPPPSPPSASRSPLEDCFSKGSLIRLRGGRVVRVEELKTEDFVRSAEGSEAIRLDPSTVVALEERPEAGTARLTLAYGSEKRRTQVELESTLEQPFFVVGRGWASVCPERSLRRFGLSCLRLRIGHVCISLTERTNSKTASTATVVKDEHPKTTPFDIKTPEDSNGENKSSTQLSTCASDASNNARGFKTSHENLTSVSFESKPINSGDVKSVNKNHSSPESTPNDEENVHCSRSLSPASRKRRWSAPGPLSNDEEEETKNVGPVQPRQNRSSLGVTSVHTVVES